MKKLLYILIMTILMIHLVACGGDKEKTETASSSSSAETPVKSSSLKKIGGLEEKKEEKEQVITGYYKVDSMTMGEETYDRNMLEEIGMAEAIYLVLEEDGNGRMCFEEEAEITYDETQIYADGGGASYVWKGNTITIEIEGVTLVMLRSTEIPPEPGTVAAEGAFPTAFAEEISGDWHGMIVAEEGTGELQSAFDANSDVLEAILHSVQ